MSEERRRYFEPRWPSSSASGARFTRVTSRTPPVQRKPTISSPGDPYEREADEVADKVMRMADPVPIGSASAEIQRKCVQCEDEESKSIQATRAPSANPEAPLKTMGLRTAEQSGTPIPGELLSYFEPRFGRDFSSVRVHHNSAAAESARAMNARAYTVGCDVVFGAGEYRPETTAGKRLVAHELVHTIQQGHAKPIQHPNVPVAGAYSESVRERVAAGAVQRWNAGIADAALVASVSAESGTPPTTRLKTHTTVLQRASAPTSSTMITAPPLGSPMMSTAPAHAPLPKSSPRGDMQAELEAELNKYERADAILAWIRRQKQDKPSPLTSWAMVPLVTFTVDDLLADAPRLGLRPPPKTPDDLRPGLDLLVYHGVLFGTPSQFIVYSHPDTGQPRAERFNDTRAALKERLDKVKKHDAPLVTTEKLPVGMVDDRVYSARAARAAAKGALAAEKRCATPEGQADKHCEKLRSKLSSKEAALESVIAKAEVDPQMSTFRTFARSVAAYLRQLHAEALKAGIELRMTTRTGHQWGEFSVDVYLTNAATRSVLLSIPKWAANTSIDVPWGSICKPATIASLTASLDGGEKFSGEFYEVDKAKTFFEIVDRVARKGVAGYGIFGWFAIYNDCDVVDHVNATYGAGRCLTAEGHGPDNWRGIPLHIHLNVRPADLRSDELEGYTRKGSRLVPI